jgi:hypothetical protein
MTRDPRDLSTLGDITDLRLDPASIADLRRGDIVTLNGELYRVVRTHHTGPTIEPLAPAPISRLRAFLVWAWIGFSTVIGVVLVVLALLWWFR